MKKLIMVGIVLLFINMVYAEQTVKSVDIPLGHKSLSTPNEILMYNFTVDFPDGINKILSLEFYTKGDYLANTKIYGGIIVANITVFCTPIEWLIPPWNVDGYEVNFDCTSLVKASNWAGDPNTPLTFVFMADNFGSNVKPRIRMTYYNEPIVSIQIHGTEYNAGDKGKVFLQLLDETDNPINSSTCYTSIYYPNNIIWKYKQLMNYVDEGIYVYDFTAPYTAGVYPVSALCTVPELVYTNRTIEDDFNSGGVSGGTGWSNNWNIDSCYYENVNVYEGAYSIECANDRNPNRNILSNTTFNALDYSFYWRGDSLEAGDIISYVITDASSVQHILLTITDGNDDGLFHQETGTLHEIADSFDFDGEIKFEIITNGNLGTGDYYNLDLLEINLVVETPINETIYEIIRGTGEVHVSSDTNYDAILMLGELRNTSFLEDFIFHYDIISQTSNNMTGQIINMPLWLQFPCYYILDVKNILDNGSIQNLNYTGKVDDFGRCVVSVEMNLNFQETYDIEIRTENYWKLKFYEDYHTILLEQEMINISCQNYRIANNLSDYIVPINISLFDGDNLWSSCNTYLDKSYHYIKLSQTFFEYLNVNYNFTYENMELLESYWVHMIDVKEDTNAYANTIFNGLNLGNSYSLGLISDPHPPTNPLYATYFSSISSSYLNYLTMLGMPTKVWNYTTRNLTYYPPASVDINYTEVGVNVWNSTDRTLTNLSNVDVDIGNAVWSSGNYTINAGVIAQFVTNIWDYVARYTHGIIT